MSAEYLKGKVAQLEADLAEAEAKYPYDMEEIADIEVQLSEARFRLLSDFRDPVDAGGEVCLKLAKAVQHIEFLESWILDRHANLPCQKWEEDSGDKT